MPCLLTARAPERRLRPVDPIVEPPERAPGRRHGRVADRRARARLDDGVTSLEMTIIFPAILLVVLGMFQISLYWHTSNAVGVAAEQAVDAGQVYPDDPALAVSEAEAAANWILTSSTSMLNPDVDVAIDGDLLTVTVAVDSPRIIGIGRWRVSSVAQDRFEEFVPATDR